MNRFKISRLSVVTGRALAPEWRQSLAANLSIDLTCFALRNDSPLSNQTIRSDMLCQSGLGKWADPDNRVRA